MTALAAPIVEHNLVVITILRAGLAMTSSAISLFPEASVGFAGLRRDEKTAIAEEYYWQIPKISASDIVLLLDPMLATGGSLLHVLRKLETTKNVRLITIISAPEGVAAIHNEFPNLPIYTAAVDEKLNDKKYIVPGLGDFGDRYFGTE
jgi:uracil phosphoribosyltransferase